jgi:hypothetical protein
VGEGVGDADAVGEGDATTGLVVGDADGSPSVAGVPQADKTSVAARLKTNSARMRIPFSLDV